MSTEEKSFRGFDDEFTTYTVADLTFPVKTLSFAETKKIKELSKVYDKVAQDSRDKKVTDGDRVDAQDQFIEDVMRIMVSPEMWEQISTNPRISKPTLWNVVRDLYNFLQVIGSAEEMKLLQTQLSSMKSTS